MRQMLKKGDLIRGLMEKVRVKRPRGDRQRFLFQEFAYKPFSEAQATRLVDALFEIIKSRLISGEQILISGFGKFRIRHKWARKGRNPRTGEPLIIKPKRVVIFRSSSKLKQKINQNRRLSSK
jgi:integration host factor subunit alpha